MSYSFCYNDIDIWNDEPNECPESSSNDDPVIRKLASIFYWEGGMPDFSIRDNRDVLKERLLEYGYTCVDIFEAIGNM